MMEGKLRKKREKMVRMRVTMEERMTRTRVELKGEPLKKEIQEVPGMATLVHLFSPKCGPLMPTMTTNVFKNLRDHYQIPDHIPIRLPGKFEKCYLRKTTDVNMYDAMFTAGLRLPLMSLHRQLANFLVLSVTQIAPNA